MSPSPSDLGEQTQFLPQDSEVQGYHGPQVGTSFPVVIWSGVTRSRAVGQKECMWEGWVKERVCLASSRLRLEERGVKRKLEETENRGHLYWGSHTARKISGRQSSAWDQHPGAPCSVQLGS